MGKFFADGGTPWTTGVNKLVVDCSQNVHSKLTLIEAFIIFREIFCGVAAESYFCYFPEKKEKTKTKKIFPGKLIFEIIPYWIEEI